MKRLIIIPLLLIFVFLSGCSQLNRAKDLVTNPTARERYQRDFNISSDLFQIWEEQARLALSDSIQIELPYLQTGRFLPKSFQVYSYNVQLNPGERIDIAVEPDSASSLVFIDLFVRENDSVAAYRKVTGTEYDKRYLRNEIKEPGLYKIVIQPEINANSAFSIKMRKSSVYDFPVAGGANKNIQSLWGASRDGGRRSHEGIDIFALRGTPVIAATNGRITSSGERGLGGKQVWLRDTERGQSLYYAHLDSIAPLGNSRVKKGDTLGFVGNTGNARTTAPHLHFGIYKGYSGAIDPLSFVYQIPEPDFAVATVDTLVQDRLVTRTTSNLRDQPTTRNSRIIGNLTAQDTLQMLGKAKEWFHIRTAQKQAAFIHESLVSPI
ncbi:M23 family metallopeptidase [Antarcticibacterium flavum]|uniref:M23 family metallopeptidase n=1 Tax=Antarcticibacterium flavum TaxID=2058175 RepID=A0A5B7X4Y6_9FLAO|nr:MULTISPECIES: M23 family metallopeptidase [Antarcticibacterium]MCM4160550.1 peptidase M23 [Antarcticibacterium sp. W02-3]QCY69788.1 M23 family metallopeptidase [Antarcticibacterium flavum]